MDARRPIVAANWKMHKTHREAVQAVQKLSDLLGREDTDGVEVVVCPPFTALRAVQRRIESDRRTFAALELGAQNVHFEEKGAFTGEISAPMLQALRCRYVIVGHSERRQHFAETDELVNKKVRAVFAHEMTPILCVGESLEERDAGSTQEKVVGQIRRGLEGVAAGDAERIVVAYEPIWAIGTGRNAEPQDAGQVMSVIRETIASLYSKVVADGVRVQYGGSVKADNVGVFMAHPEIDGALVGGASLDPEEFALIVQHGAEAKPWGTARRARVSTGSEMPR